MKTGTIVTIILAILMLFLASCGKRNTDNYMPVVNDHKALSEKPWMHFRSGIGTDGTKHHYYKKGDSIRWIAVYNDTIITDRKWK